MVGAFIGAHVALGPLAIAIWAGVGIAAGATTIAFAVSSKNNRQEAKKLGKIA